MSASEQIGVPAAVDVGGPPVHSLGTRIRRYIRRQPVGAISLVIIAVLVFGAVFAPWLRTSNPEAVTGAVLLGPSTEHWFGTNRDGTDMWSRVLYGARPSLIIGFMTVVVGLTGGLVIGLLAGYAGGLIDFMMSRAIEFVIAFPPIIVGIIVAAALGPGLRSVIIAITAVVVAVTGRVIRGAVLQHRESDYVLGARVIGASWPRIVFRHIMPNVIPLAIVLASALLPTAILFEASLTFLGFGLPQGQPSWGADLGGTTRTYFSMAPWLAIFPGLALSLTILAFNMFGDSLRDIFDPRLRGSGF